MSLILKKIKSFSNRKEIRIIRKNRSSFMSILVVLFSIDIFFIKSSSDLIIFGLTSYYVMGVFLFRLKSNTTTKISLCLCIIMILSYLTLGSTSISEKAGVWLFLFLLIGIIQQWNE